MMKGQFSPEYQVVLGKHISIQPLFVRHQPRKTQIGALWRCWTVLRGVSRCKQFRFESTFKTSKAVSRSSVYRQWVPHSGRRDGEGTRRNRSEY